MNYCVNSLIVNYRKFISICFLLGIFNLDFFALKKIYSQIWEKETSNTQNYENSSQQKSYDGIIKKDNLIDSYILGPGDVLSLTLFGAEEFSGEYKILNDGSVPLPLLGTVRLSHLSLQKASEYLYGLYKQQLIRAELHLQVINPRPIKVSVIGEVLTPGIYTFKTKNNTNNNYSNDGLPTVVDAIQLAGGISPNANLKKINLERRLPGENLKYRKTTLNLFNLLLEGNQTNNPYLFDGDVIKISKTEKLSDEIIKLTQANLSPKEIEVNVIGQVKNPGRISVKPNTPLVQAILLAGGPIDWEANKGNVELVRLNEDGSATLKKLKIDLKLGVSKDKNPPLKYGDTIKVNPTNLSRFSGGISTVGKPAREIVTLFKLLNE